MPSWQDSRILTKYSPRYTLGFTIVELVISISLVGLLAVLLFPALEKMRTRAERIVCIGNLQSIYTALNLNLDEKRQWPQVPDGLEDPELLGEFWGKTLEPYGIGPKVWSCPSLTRFYQDDPASFQVYQRIHYTPAEFDENPARPRQLMEQPWVMEIGSVHGGGNLYISADGQLRDVSEMLKSMGLQQQ